MKIALVLMSAAAPHFAHNILYDITTTMYVYFYGVSQNQDQIVRRLSSTQPPQQGYTRRAVFLSRTTSWLSMKRSKRRVRSISLEPRRRIPPLPPPPSLRPPRWWSRCEHIEPRTSRRSPKEAEAAASISFHTLH